MLRNAALEELYERNGKALGMNFTVDEDVLKNESGKCTCFRVVSLSQSSSEEE